ncbi:MAG: serine hydrolase, partial [Fimbriiglobus sp.]
AKATDRAGGHRRRPDGSPDPMPGWDIAEPNPSGSMSATARDLGAWVRFQLNSGKWGGKQLVSAENLRETRTAQILQRPTVEVRGMYPASQFVGYGLGWVVYDHRGERVVAHGGVADGFRAQITLLPDRGLGFALLNNLHDTKMNVAIGNALIDHALGLPPRDWNAYFQKLEADERAAKSAAQADRAKARKPDILPSYPLEKYVGEYDDRAYGTGRVTLAAGRLVWEWSSFVCPLEHWEADTFRVTAGYFENAQVRFAVDNGTVVGVRAMDVNFVRK